MNARLTRRIVYLGAACILTLPSFSARGNILRDLGSLLGQPLGGFLGAATAPVLANVEGTANQIVAQVDKQVHQEIDHAGAVVSGVADHTIEKVNAATAAWLNQADGIVTTRIDQVFTDADVTAAKAFSQMGALEKNTFKDAGKLVKTLNDDLKADIDRVDGVLDTRIHQVDGVVKNAIGEVDGDIKARIDQADEVAQKALGTADVLVAKEILGLQAALLKIGAMLGAVAFLVTALKYLFDHFPEYLRDVEAVESRQRAAGLLPAQEVASLRTAKRALRFKYAKRSLGLLAVHVVFGGICIAFLFGLASVLPLGARRDASRLTQTHEAALGQSLSAFDFTKVRYHAAELSILNPADEQKYRALQRRAELIRALLTRPGLLATADGLRQISSMIEETKLAQVGGDGKPFEAADVVAAAGYVRWQLAASRRDEAAAIALFVHAIDVDGTNPNRTSALGRFVLEPLAARYVALFCQRRPAAFEWPDGVTPAHTLDDACKSGSMASDQPGFQAFARYDEAVLALDRKSDEAYLNMLDAQAALARAKGALGKHRAPSLGDDAGSSTGAQQGFLAAKKARLQAAQAVKAAWVTFDGMLRSDSTMPPSAQLASFWLNDVPLMQAAWVISRPDEVDLPLRIGDIPLPALRATVSPARISWARRYLNPLSAESQIIAAREVVRMYQDDEQRTAQFATAYLAYKAGAGGDAGRALRDAAAKAASAMGLYGSGSPRVPLAQTLLAGDKTSPAAIADDGVRLRLL